MKRILVTGGTGFIGQRLVRELLDRGDLITVLTRDVARARRKLPGAVRTAAWDPTRNVAGKAANLPWFEEVGIVDAVVHLAGEVVATRWTEDKKRQIVQSRVGSTELLVEAIAASKKKPSVLVSASATGYYGPRSNEEECDEDTEAGRDFLADVCEKWEDAARAAEEHGVRSVQVRIGIVLGQGGGALEQMVTPFKFFAGGPIGDGKQPVSWVHRDDVVGLFMFAIDHEEVKGPLNAVSPYAVTNAQLADAIGTVLNRPSWLHMPPAALRLAFGEAADVLASGQRVYPRRAAQLGYEFRQARLIRALESILGE